METRLNNIIKILDDKKAENIEVIDLTNKDYITDKVVISTALNNKHSISLVGHLKDELKPLGEEIVMTEEDEDWSIVDLGDVMIHIMTQSHREKYDIEDFLAHLEESQAQ